MTNYIQPVVLSCPEDPCWVDRLRNGNQIHLVKENDTAFIQWEYQYGANSKFGRLGLITYNKNNSTSIYGNVKYHTWTMTPDGKGFDGKQLILPIEGHLAKEPENLSIPELRAMDRRISRLEQHIRMLNILK